jgi:amino acid transporter
MVFYGLGTIIGAGIYVLIGEIAAQAGAWSPLAFIAAAFIASFTGLSYAELVGRYPRSAGEAVYVETAFHKSWLTEIVGWSVVLTGIVSAATLLKGFSGYFIHLLGGTDFIIIGCTLLLMSLLACSGVKKSVGFAVGVTILELLGLLLVIFIASGELTVTANWQRWSQDLSHFSWSGIVAATFLAFYAFIGFEDMVNMAEEVEDVSNVLPKAIIIAIVASTIIYLLMAMVAVVAVPIENIANSRAPLTALVAPATWFPSWLISVISLIAIINGVIVQLLMASRVVYGLTQTSKTLGFLSTINSTTHTPIIATVLISFFVLCFALWMPLAQLATLTSFIILCLFVLVNSSLLIIKKNHAYKGFQVPSIIPVIGVIASSLLLLVQILI